MLSYMPYLSSRMHSRVDLKPDAVVHMARGPETSLLATGNTAVISSLLYEERVCLPVTTKAV